MTLSALLFDKDGTLFDFAATWNSWTHSVLTDLAEGEPALRARLAEAIDFDLEACAFHATSIAIAGTNAEISQILAQHLPGRSPRETELYLAETAGQAELQPAVPLAPYLQELKARGLRLGVMTNDNESSALQQLQRAGVLDLFDMVIGFDSGFGAKPDPDPLLAFADRMGLAPETVAMIGDSLHDLVAGRAAGMQTVGVLTGMAPEAELAPKADVVMPHIGHIPAWLDQL